MRLQFSSLITNQRFSIPVGFLVGALSFLISELLVPDLCRTISEYDHLLAIRIGLIYTPVAACWFSISFRGSLKRMGRQLLLGVMIGALYASLSFTKIDSGNSLILFPGILAALLSVLTNVSDKSGPLLTRFLRLGSDGLCAGSVFGLTYSLLLSVGAVCLWLLGLISCQHPSLTTYVQAMSWGGPLAFGFASGVFFLLIKRSSEDSSKVLLSSTFRETARLLLTLLIVIVCSNWRFYLRWMFHLAASN